MHAVVGAAQSGGVTDAHRAEKIQQRLDRLGISDREFENKTGVDRKALRRAANGEPVRRSTYVAVETWLDRIEEEVGLDDEPLPDGVTRVGEPDQDLFAVEVYTPEGKMIAVFKGPVKDAEVVRREAAALIAMREEAADLRRGRP